MSHSLKLSPTDTFFDVMYILVPNRVNGENNNCADQPAWKCRLLCTIVVNCTEFLIYIHLQSTVKSFKFRPFSVAKHST